MANHYPPANIQLFTSDEPPPKSKRGTVEENLEKIQNYFHKAGVQVLLEAYNMDEFEANVLRMATIAIQQYTKFPDFPIIFDLTAGRGPISHALARAGQIIVDYYKLYREEELLITCALQPFQSELVTYTLGTSSLPNKKDLELLGMVEKRVTQTRLARELGWNNQSEVSKALHRLVDLNLVEISGHRERKLTQTGRSYRWFLRRLDEG